MNRWFWKGVFSIFSPVCPLECSFVYYIWKRVIFSPLKQLFMWRTRGGGVAIAKSLLTLWCNKVSFYRNASTAPRTLYHHQNFTLLTTGKLRINIKKMEDIKKLYQYTSLKKINISWRKSINAPEQRRIKTLKNFKCLFICNFNVLFYFFIL